LSSDFGYLLTHLTTHSAYQAPVATNTLCLNNYAINILMYKRLHAQLTSCLYYKFCKHQAKCTPITPTKDREETQSTTAYEKTQAISQNTLLNIKLLFSH